MYFGMPQHPMSEPPTPMSVEEIIIGAEEGDVNCLEWLGYDIEPKSPPKPSETHAVCKGCAKELPLDQFYRDTRKRNGRMSSCRICANRKRLIRYHRGRDKKGRSANPAV